MAEEVYRIEIPINVEDQTNPALEQAQSRVTKFEQGLERTKKQMDRMNQTKIELILNAVDHASGIISQVHTRATNLTRKAFHVTLTAIDLVTGPFRAITHMLSSPLGMLGAGAGMAGLIGAPLNSAGDMEQAQIAFTTMLGSAVKAQDFLRQLQNFAAATPFEFPQLQDASKMLLAFQFQAQDIIPMMTAIGNAAAGLGVGQDGIQRIILALGQMKAAGTIHAQDMMQLTSVGINGWKMLADAMGKSQEQVRALSEKGLLPADQALKILIDGMDKTFPHMMDKQSHSLLGLFSTIKDTFNMNIFMAWGQGIAQAVEPRLQKLVDWFGKNNDAVNQWRQTISKAGQTVADTLLSDVERLEKALSDLARTDAWQKADAFSRIKLAWDKVIVEPFDQWWSSGGNQWVINTAEKIGHGMGSTLGSFLITALGVTDSNRIEDNPFVNAGTTAGIAFFNAFWDAFDADAIAKKALGAFKNIAVDSTNILPGGKPATAGTYFEAMMMAGLTAKILHGGGSILKDFNGLRQASGKALNWFKDFSGMNRPGWESLSKAGNLATAATPGSATVARTAEAVDHILPPIYGPSGQILSTMADTAKVTEPAIAEAAMRSGADSIFKSGLRAGGHALGKLAVPVGVAMDAYNIATAKTGFERGEAIGGAVGGWGGAAGGAAIGTLILPGVGTVIGGLLGGLIGSLGGEWAGGKIAQAGEGSGKTADAMLKTAGTTYDAQKGLAQDAYSSQMYLAQQVYAAQDRYAQAAYTAQQAMYQATKDSNAAPVMLVSIADAALSALGVMFNQSLLQYAADTGQIGHWEDSDSGDAGASMGEHWVPATTNKSSEPQVNVTVAYNPNYNITAKADAEDILQVVRDNHRQISEDVSQEIAKEMEKTFQNSGTRRRNFGSSRGYILGSG